MDAVSISALPQSMRERESRYPIQNNKREHRKNWKKWKEILFIYLFIYLIRNIMTGDK